MKYVVTISSDAENDIAEATVWYAEIRIELAFRFLDNLEIAFDFIEKYAETLQVRENLYRAISVKKFPYNISYRLKKNIVEIIAVMHQKRDPVRIFERLRN